MPTAAASNVTRYFLPPEWAPQWAVLLVWPHVDTDWASDLPLIGPTYGQLVAAITRFQLALVVVQNDRHQQDVAQQLSDAGANAAQIRFLHARSNDTWVRDFGPITVMNAKGEAQLLDFQFNGWGGKYDASWDNALTGNLYRAGAFGKAPLRNIDFILEGGSIDADGQGNLLTTTQCLLTPTRNQGWSRDKIEQMLIAQLGIRRIIWLENGYLAGDDTDSHVDMLVRFCDPGTLCHVECTDPNDEHFAALSALAEEVKALRNFDGQPYRCVGLPMPAAKFNEAGERLPASHANFLIINRAVLVPVYDDPTDAVALARLAQCFPDREIIPLPGLPFIRQKGGIHCATMQIPAAVGRTPPLQDS